MKKLGFAMSSCGFQDLSDKNFKELASAGVQGIELSFNAEKYNSIDWKTIKKRADQYNVPLWSLHLPFSGELNIAEHKYSRTTIESHIELMKKASEIDIGIFVLHPSAEPYCDNERAEAIKRSQESLCKLAECAKNCGGVIAVENLPRTCLGRNSDAIKQLISVDNSLRVCFDTNHLLDEPIVDFIRAVGDKIVTTHFSDYDLKNERHWLPGEGVINWHQLISELEAVQYKGPILYELNLLPSYSIQRRNLTFEDFKENHMQLISKKSPAPIGTPILSKCTSWKQTE